MSENKKIRLSGVAREYNVGIGTLIEFLEKKGVKTDLTPNTQIEGGTLDLVRAEFGKDKLERVHSREKLRSELQTVAPEAIQSPPAEVVAEKEVFVKSNAIFSPKVEPLQQPKVLGTVDLSDKKGAGEPAKIEPIAKVVEPIRAESAKSAEPAMVAPTQVAEPAKAESAKAESVKVVEPVIAEPAKADPAKVEPAKAAPTIIEPVKVQPSKAEPAKAAAPQEAARVAVAQESQKPAEDSRISESGIFRANEPEKLTGPVVLGTMVLPLPRTNTRPTGDKTGKRNRIKKNKVDIATQAPGTNPRPAGAAGTTHGTTPGRIPGRISPASANRPRTTPRPLVRAEVSEEDVQKQIKETLARLTNKGGKGKGAKYRRDKRDAVGVRMAEEAEMKEQQSSTLQLTEFVTVSELASMMNVTATQVITVCMNLGLMVSINQRLDAEALAIVAEEFGFKVEFVSVEIQEAIDVEVDKEEDLETRPPIVTVMGHVDHGKTSLLDYIRKANVIQGEAGGITQHIGAYSVKMEDGRRITFLDTPGHEAFTAMRARGAKVTDVVIIIVAADDSIMPQTIEAINHASAAGVPMIFAINKIDKDAADPEKIKEQLAGMNYLVEDWGGKYQSQDIAAKSGLNVDKLLEKIILESEMLTLRANPNRKASGTVVESTLDKGRGFMTTVLVSSGTLHVGDVILSGTHTGRVKAMFNERGIKVKQAGPSTPVLVLGLNGAPQAGDMFNVMEDDKQARDIASKRDQLQRMQGLRTQKHITLDEIGRRIAIGSFKELNLIIKGDVDGSIEALADSLLKLGNEEVQVNVIHKAVGQISESDILLAAASNAIVIGFQVRPSTAARRLAEKEEIDVRLYSIIYDAIGEVKDAIEGMLAPETKEEITCSVEIIEIFKITKVGTVAGCMVREGKVTRNTKIRVIRDGIVVHTGKLGSLKRFKDDVKEVSSGYDCGLNIEGFNDMKVGDFVEGYEQVEVARKLS